MKRVISLCPLVFALVGCVTFRFGGGFQIDPKVLGGQTQAEQTIKAIACLINKEAQLPDDFETRLKAGYKPGDFDPNRYFAIFKHIEMESGFSLDYVYTSSKDYAGDIMGGEPKICAVPSAGISRETAASNTEVRKTNADVFLHVVADGTPEGFLELAILRIMGNQFYVFWHAIPMKDYVPICGRETANNILTPLGLLFVKKSDFEPKVLFSEDTATVSVLTFSNWAGLSRSTYVFRRTFPHRLFAVKRKCLFYYNRHFGVHF